MYLVLVLIFITYHLNIFHVFSIGTYGVTLSDLTTLLFFILVVKRLYWDGEPLKFVPNGALYFVLILLAAAIISGFNPLLSTTQAQIIQYFKTFSHFLFLVSFALVCALYPINSDIWTKIIKIWLILSIFINIFGIYQIVARAFDLPFGWIDITNPSFTARGSYDEELASRQLSLRFSNFFRATSIYSEPSALAGFNLFILTFTAIPFIQRKPPFLSKGLTIFIFILCIISLLLAYSLTGLLGAAMILGTAIIFHFSPRIVKSIPIILILISAVIITDIIVYNYSGASILKLFEIRITGILNPRASESMAGESFFTRMETIENSLSVWQRNPILGIGLGLIQFDEYTDMVFSENGITSVLAEMGLLGFVAFVGLFVSLFYLSFKLLKLDKPSIPIDNRVSGLLFYIMFILLIQNYIAGNSLVQCYLWNFVGMFLALFNQYYQSMGLPVRIVRLTEKPLKYYFEKYISSFR